MPSSGPVWPDPERLPALPPVDSGFEPASFLVTLDTGDRVHYLDWGGPTDPAWLSRALPPLLLLHGIRATAWSWAPIARRLRAVMRVLAPDLRGHGLSEAPATGYELESLAIDALTVLVANGFGPDANGPPAVLAGHGFGAVVAVAAAAMRPAGAAGLALVDGGWEAVPDGVEQAPAEFVKGLEEPPEVMRSMEAYLTDRRAFDPGSWDADQERAARAAVAEKHAGHVVPVVPRNALVATATTLLAYRPAALLPLVEAPVLAVVADGTSPDDERAREHELALQDAMRIAAGVPAWRVVRLHGVGHNVMRYRPRTLAAELLALALLGVAMGRR